MRDQLSSPGPAQRITRMELEDHLGRGAEGRIRRRRGHLHGAHRSHHPQS